MRRVINGLKMLVLFMLLFMIMPVVSHADIIVAPDQPVYELGPVIVVILFTILILIGISIFVLKDSKREKMKRLLRIIVTTGAYIMMFWFVFSIAEELIIYAEHNGRFSVKKDFVDLIFLFVITAIFIISLIFRIQKKEKLATILLIVGWILIILIHIWCAIVLIYVDKKEIYIDLLFDTFPDVVYDTVLEMLF